MLSTEKLKTVYEVRSNSIVYIHYGVVEHNYGGFLWTSGVMVSQNFIPIIIL